MAFLSDKEELKPGLVIFRREDVAHRNWYCRVKVPREDRYKTISLKTSDVGAARERAFDQDADLRFRLKHEVPVFNRPFSAVAKDFVAVQMRRAEIGQISKARVVKIESVLKAQLNPYVGSTQVHLVGHDRWDQYPFWRREHGEGRRVKGQPEDVQKAVSDATIRFEMSIFRSIMAYAASKKFITLDQVPGGRLPLAKVRREEFRPEEYRKLHTFARGWVKQGRHEPSRWAREMTYLFVLIMCNTGMRPPEAKNLRWCDVDLRTDGEGRKIVILSVRGKGKHRQLIAAANVGDYLERVRAQSHATQPNDHVFTLHNGKPALTLYQTMVQDLLEKANLKVGPDGTPRSTYSFRHTYATFRLSEGVDVYFLAQQMGTSVKMIEDHYGHVNPVKNAQLILRGMRGWGPISDTARPETAEQKTERPMERSRKASNKTLAATS